MFRPNLVLHVVAAFTLVVGLTGCPMETGNANPDDDAIDQMMDSMLDEMTEELSNQLSYIVVQLNVNSDAPLSDLLFEDNRGGIEAFGFPSTVPPGNAGQACCVRPGVYDLTIGAGGVQPHFELFERQMLFGGMDHIYTVTIMGSEIMIDDFEIREHVNE